MTITCVDGFLVCRIITLSVVGIETKSFYFTSGKQAVLVLSCDNGHMAEDVMVEPGLVMIFAHGVSE